MAKPDNSAADQVEKAIIRNSGLMGQASRAIRGRQARLDAAIERASGSFSSAPKHYDKK